MTPIFTAIGNACTDFVASVEDNFLVQHNIPKGLCRFITDGTLLTPIKAQMGEYQSIPGGAGANVAHVVSALGHNSHFISKVGSDEDGAIFKNHMETNGVACHFPAPTLNIGTCQVLTFITPDSERTFLSFDAVAATFAATDYDFDLLNTTNFLYLDGYCYVSKGTPQGFIKAAVAVRHRGGHVTFNIGDLGYYATHKNDIDDLLNACDSIICNLSEAKALFGPNDDINILAQKMSDQFLFGAITDGKNGAIVFHNKTIAHIPAPPIEPSNLQDTNGAGDHFSAGFIYGLMNGYSLEQAGRLGILCATDCISHAGARPLGGHGSLKHLADEARS